MVAFITRLWHLLENGFNKISVQRKLHHCIESHGQASGDINRKQHVLVLVLEHEEMRGTEGNEHGSNGHEEGAQAEEKLQWQAPAEVFSLLSRGEYGKEHYKRGDREAESDKGSYGKGVECRLAFQ